MTSVEYIAFPMVSSSSSASHKYEGYVSLSSDSSWKIISVVSEWWKSSSQGAWTHNLWEECKSPGGKTPQLAETQGMIALALSTWKEFRSEYR